MKLYYSPGSCSLAVHTVLIWSGLEYELVKVDLSDKTWMDINPMGAVPAMIGRNNILMTQTHALINYIARAVPEQNIVGEQSEVTRQETEQWLAFVNGDLHPAFMPIFAPERFTTHHTFDGFENVKKAASKRLKLIFEVLNTHLQNRQFMVGEQRTGADAFIYIMSRWLPYTFFDLAKFPNLKTHFNFFENDSGIIQAETEQGIRE